jgi:hypothetical protein
MQVTKGSAMNRPLFPSFPSRYIADPDTVIVSGVDIPLVLDAKYKQLDTYPEHDDVYQLFSHCSAIGAFFGILLYPGQTFRFEVLGTTSSGAKIGFSTVRIGSLRSDLSSLTMECALTKGAL